MACDPQTLVTNASPIIGKLLPGIGQIVGGGKILVITEKGGTIGFDPTLCQPEIDGAFVVEGGGDKFDCYADKEGGDAGRLPSSAGVGFSGRWQSSDGTKAQGDNFNTYADGDGSTQTLNAGTGLLSSWIDGDHVGVESWSDRVVANGGAAPSVATVNALLTFESALQSAGILDKILTLNAFVPDSLIAALTPQIIRSGAGNGLWTNVNFVSGDLTTAGLTGNGSTKRLDTGFNPSIQYVSNYGNKNDAGMSILVETVASAGFDLSSNTGASSGFGGSINVFDCWNNGTERVLHSNGVAGFYSNNRVASNDSRAFFVNSGTPLAQIGSTVTAGVANPPSVLMDAFASNRSGIHEFFSGNTLSFIAIHLGLSLVEVQNLYDAVDTLRTALGGGSP